jgi:hypothetical protein
MAEAEQFALDSLVAPAGIVSGHLLDQSGYSQVDGRAAGTAGICPMAGDQPPMPTQDRGRGDEPVGGQRPASAARSAHPFRVWNPTGNSCNAA